MILRSPSIDTSSKALFPNKVTFTDSWWTFSGGLHPTHYVQGLRGLRAGGGQRVLEAFPDRRTCSELPVGVGMCPVRGGGQAVGGKDV